jgi:hypothetical protein
VWVIATAHFAALTDVRLRRNASLLSASRARVVESLSGAALAGLAHQHAKRELSGDRRRTAEDAASLGLVEARGSAVVFSSSILEGYLAATELARREDPVSASRHLIDDGGRQAAVAVVIAAGLLAERSPSLATTIARDIVRWSGTREDGARFPSIRLCATRIRWSPGRRSSASAPSTARFAGLTLIADVIVALNLIEGASRVEDERGDRRVRLHAGAAGVPGSGRSRARPPAGPRHIGA